MVIRTTATRSILLIREISLFLSIVLIEQLHIRTILFNNVDVITNSRIITIFSSDHLLSSYINWTTIFECVELTTTNWCNFTCTKRWKTIIHCSDIYEMTDIFIICRIHLTSCFVWIVWDGYLLEPSTSVAWMWNVMFLLFEPSGHHHTFLQTVSTDLFFLAIADVKCY